MHVTHLTLLNFGPFAGEQTVLLDRGVYAVTAQQDRDPSRSNWQGKSTFLTSFAFALFGHHAFDSEDALITYGENSGGVALRLSDGHVVERYRTRGASTKLVVSRDGVPVCGQKEAQTFLHTLLGLTKTDYLATCFFEQGRMSRFIRSEPSERTKLVASWLQLGDLEKAAQKAQELLRAQHEHRETFRREMSRFKLHLESYWTRLFETLPEATEEEKKTLLCFNLPDDVIEPLYEKFDDVLMLVSKRLDEQVEEAGQEVALKEQERKNLDEKRDAIQAGRRYRELLPEGLAMKERLEKEFGDVPEAHVPTPEYHIAREAFEAARRALTTHANHRQCGFDGKCPVTTKACPASDSVNAELSRSTDAQKLAQERFDATHASWDLESEKNSRASRRFDEAQRLRLRLDTLRAEARKLAWAKAQPESLEEEETAISEAVRDSTTRIAELRMARKRVLELRDKATADRKAYGLVKHNLALTLREIELLAPSVQVLGPNGAQRRIAEHALAGVEQKANLLLLQSGIDLHMRVKWAREGGDLAHHCNACGHPFPTSKKVLSCAKCGEDRGPHLINQLHVQLSDRSGAAEDLAGCAIQLAVSAWLRAQRSSTWRALFLDEPFGQLDRSHRQHLAARIASGIEGFEQTFVIAHEAGLMDAFPNRISLVGTSSGTKVKADGIS